MEITRLDRAGALAGAAYVLLVVLGNDVLGSGAPDSTATAAEIGTWWRAHPPTSSTWAAALVELVGLLLFPVFTTVLAWRLRVAEERRTWLPWVVLGSGLLSAAVKLASGAPAFAVAWRAADVPDDLAAALVDMNAAAFVLTWAIDAVMLAAAAAVVLRTRCLPRTLGWTAAAIAPLLLASVAGGVNGPPVFLLALLWFVAASVTLAVRRAAVRVG